MHLSCAQETLLYLCILRIRRSIDSVRIQQDQRLLVIRNASLVLVFGFHVIGIYRRDELRHNVPLFWSIHVFLSVEASRSTGRRG